ncbi:CAMK family protein kinase [Tritrichomonas foetus]|uniref:CAMK family protein kinase n=1 Tax=Tritrichomonas foetus TaxID=1144522 RepID=A0A1J4JHB1_9EUKA|nr:CAMK family protein kinase [Tritrichomonas foetus]|eukprot:OHS98536.1 CAMK family protein kinase [Tritrichomonas foetus]
MIEETTDSGEQISIPLQFTHYKYEKTIGAGASAVVILVSDSIFGNKLAAKVVSRKMLIEENRIEYFERELRLLQRIKHPNIIAVNDIVYLPEIIIIVQEFCENGDLLAFIANHGTLNLSLTRKLFYQLVCAVDYLHSKGIAHRDLKPENIFIDINCNIKLGDFGLSHEIRNNSLLSTLCGTLYYSAPEVISHNNYDGTKADIWSLGILLFCMINGTLPWVGTNPDEIAKEISLADLKIPQDFPIFLEEIVRKCTRLCPEERPTTLGILESKWLSQEHSQAQRCRSLSSKAEIAPSTSSKQLPSQFLFGKRLNAGNMPSNMFLKKSINQSLKRSSMSKITIPSIRTFSPPC